MRHYIPNDDGDLLLRYLCDNPDCVSYCRRVGFWEEDMICTADGDFCSQYCVDQTPLVLARHARAT